MATQIKVEDLILSVLTDEKGDAKSSIDRTILRSGRSKHVIKSKTYAVIQTTNATLVQFTEMCMNPYFAAVPIYDISKRINTGLITGLKRKWSANVSELSFNFIRGYGKFLFLQSSITRPISDRWKYLIMEDFSSDGDWPATGVSISTPLSSDGYGKQVQAIIWDEIVGDFKASTAIKLVDDSSIYSVNNSEDLLVAGWSWWDDYDLECWAYTNDVATDDFSLVFRYVDDEQHYIFEKSSTNILTLKSATDAGYETIATYTHAVDIEHQVWHHLRVIVEGFRIRCSYNNEEIFDLYDDSFVSGRVGIRSAEAAVYFDDFRVTLSPPKHFNFTNDIGWTNQYFHANITSAYGTEKRIISPDNDIMFTINSGTPSTVFAYDYDNPDYNRVYDQSHPFTDVPVFDNGLARIVLGGSPIVPSLWFYPGSWVHMGDIKAFVNINETDIATWDDCEYQIIDLTDQYCKVRLRFYESTTSGIPEGSFVDMYLIIVSGYPGVLIEIDASNIQTHDDVGFSISNPTIADPQYFFAPANNIQDAETGATSFGLTPAEVNDNWFIVWQKETGGHEDVIWGFFGDDLLDDLGSGDHIELTEVSDEWTVINRLGSKFGGIFFVDYSLNDLHQEADSDYADVTTDGVNDQTTLAGYTGDGYIHLEDLASNEYAQWNVGVLAKGTYECVVRCASDNTTDYFDIYIDNDGDRDGDLATDRYWTSATANIWEYFYLQFYTDGTNDVYISVVSELNNAIFVDSFYSIPETNGVNYPSNLAHQAFTELDLIRGLKR